jgi:hypothetical protein
MGPLHAVCGKTGDYERMIFLLLITDPYRLLKAADLHCTIGRIERWLKTAALPDDEELPTFAQK